MRNKIGSVPINTRGKPSCHFLSLRRGERKGTAVPDEAIERLFERPQGIRTGDSASAVDFITTPIKEPSQDKEEPPIATCEPNALSPGSKRTVAFFLISALAFSGIIFVVRDAVTLRDGAGRVFGVAAVGVAELKEGQEAGSELDFSRAYLSFSLAQQSFRDALASLEKLNRDVNVVARILPFEKSAKRALLAAHELSEVGKIAAATGDALPRAAASGAPFMILDERMGEIEAHLKNAQDALEALPFWITSVSRGQELQDALGRVSAARQEMQTIHEVVSFLNRVFGGTDQKRYLVFFQNDAELRATGGFWGSFALADFVEGKLAKIEIPDHGTYATQGEMRKRVLPPLPLAYLRDRWELQDANWYFDLPTSAAKAQDFFAWSGGASVDGIITINARLLPKLLEITGPLPVPSEQKVLTAATVLFELQRTIELDPRKDGEGPKSILSSAGPMLLERLFAADASTLPLLLDTVVQALKDGDVQMALNDETSAKEAKLFGWDGSLTDAPGDFLAVVDTNVAGGKTDAVVVETITHDVSFLGEGSVTTITTVTRAHGGSRDQGPFVGVTNRDFMRVYMQPSVRVVDVLGLDREPDLERKDSKDSATPDGLVWDEAMHAYRGEESGKQVIAGWLLLKPGEKRSMSVRSLSSSQIGQTSDNGVVSSVLTALGVRDETRRYRFFFKPQSGKTSGNMTFRLNVPEGWDVAHVASKPDGGKQLNKVVVEGDVADYMNVGVIFKRTR